MRRLIILLLLASTLLCAGLRTALPSDDEPQVRLFKREWVTERLLAARADARLNAAETGPGRLVYDLPEPEEPAIPGTAPPGPSVAAGSRMAALGERVTYKDFRTGAWRPSEPALYTTRRGWIMAGGAVDTVIRPRPIQGGMFVGLHYADPDRNDEYYWTLITFPAMAYAGDLRFTYQHNGVGWTLALSENGDGYSIASAPISTRAARTFSFPYQSSHSFTVNEAGDLVTGSITLSRAVMVGADGVRYPCTAWAVATTPNALSFTCDDAALPAAALPYVIDPTTGLTSNLSWYESGCLTWEGGYCGGAGAAQTWTFATGSLNIGTVSSATIGFDQYGFGGEDCGTILWWRHGSWWTFPRHTVVAYGGVSGTLVWAGNPFNMNGSTLLNLSYINKTGDSKIGTEVQCSLPEEPNSVEYNVYAGPPVTLTLTYTVANTAPTLVSASAISTNTHYGQWITATARVADAQGYSTIDYWHLLINHGVDGGYACYFVLNNRGNWFQLMNDAATDWGPGYTTGTATFASNSQCEADVANSSFTYPSGSTDVQANIRLRFKGNMLTRNPARTYLWAKDLSAATAGWAGTYTEGYVRPKSKLIITSQN